MKLSDVKDILHKALVDATKEEAHQTKMKALIDLVLDNTHLTFKYVLMTALASKATDSIINPLALQAGSALPGAYDARSVCHGVLVKFEMTELGKALGGSNEPFLNKPARFPHLSKANAVRKGRDKLILDALCDQLPLLEDSDDAYNALVYAMQKLLVVKESKAALTSFSIDPSKANATKLAGFIDSLLDRNHEGETLTLVIAGLYEMYMKQFSAKSYSVEVHPVNQSGASGREVSDLDVYKDDILLMVNELKDKAFVDTDVRHAVDKAFYAGMTRMNFVVGRSGSYDAASVKKIVAEYQAKGFFLNVIGVDELTRTIINLIEDIDVDSFVKHLLKVAVDTKFKETTILFIRSEAHKHFGV